MRQTTRCFFLLLATCAALVMTGDGVAFGQYNNWVRPAGDPGTWHEESNWDGGIPTDGSGLWVGNGGTVILDGNAEARSVVVASGSRIEHRSGHLELENRPGMQDSVLFVDSGATYTLSGSAELAAVIVTPGYSLIELGGGAGSEATLHVGGNARLTFPSMRIATWRGDVARMEVADSASVSGVRVDVGYYGDATVQQTGGELMARDVYIAVMEDSQSSYTVTGGRLALTGYLGVGGSWQHAPRGQGTFAVEGGASEISAQIYVQYGDGHLWATPDESGLSVINIAGTASLDGTFTVNPSDEFGRFSVLHAEGGINGTFDTVTLPDEDWLWGIDGGQTLWVEHVPEPATLSLLGLGLGALFVRRCRK